MTVFSIYLYLGCAPQELGPFLTCCGRKKLGPGRETDDCVQGVRVFICLLRGRGACFSDQRKVVASVWMEERK